MSGGARCGKPLSLKIQFPLSNSLLHHTFARFGHLPYDLRIEVVGGFPRNGPVGVQIVRLGSARAPNEGLRIGTVRRPPRGVPKSNFSSGNWYDVWLPNLAPAPETIKLALAAATPRQWVVFVKRYRAEMTRPENSRVLDLLAALSHEASFSVGCYCEDESRCHRSVLRQLLLARGASVS